MEVQAGSVSVRQADLFSSLTACEQKLSISCSALWRNYSGEVVGDVYT